jgi:putative PIG3 family NAD(P)H quinone oxidoreductase
MRAITFSQPGTPDVLVWGEADLPTPTARDVVIDVTAVGVNNADLMQRAGSYPVPAGASPILGLECAGVISWVGSDVTGWSVGDRVCALMSGGAYAEQVVVDAELLLPIPTGLTDVEAASLPEAACTVYSNLAMTAQLAAGQSLLVHGGASGIGSFAIQWAKALGVTVLTTAGSADKLERCREFGADVLINYRSEDFVEATTAATGGRGVDVVLDIVGSSYLDRNLHALAPDGHLVVIGSSGGAGDAPLNLGALMVKRLSVSGSTLRARPHAQKAAIVAAVRRDVWPLVENGKIAPVVDSVIPLPEAAAAHTLLAGGATVGKVVLSAQNAKK